MSRALPDGSQELTGIVETKTEEKRVESLRGRSGAKNGRTVCDFNWNIFN